MHPTEHMERNNILQEVTKNSAGLLSWHVLSLKHRKKQRRGERAELAGGRELPEAPRVGLCLDVGIHVPGEQMEVRVASDLQCKAWAALKAASLANDIA